MTSVDQIHPKPHLHEILLNLSHMHTVHTWVFSLSLLPLMIVSPKSERAFSILAQLYKSSCKIPSYPIIIKHKYCLKDKKSKYCAVMSLQQNAVIQHILDIEIPVSDNLKGTLYNCFICNENTVSNYSTGEQRAVTCTSLRNSGKKTTPQADICLR